MKTEKQEAPVPEPARGHDVFVSYSRADRDRVVELTEGLASRGERAWVDVEDIPPAAEWMIEIRRAIDAADGYLVVVSPDLAASKVCAQELDHAKRVVPVLVRPTDPTWVPDSLAVLNWIDAPAAVAGFPHVTVPARYAIGLDLPVGLSFFSKAWQKPQLIAFAYAFHQATNARHVTQFLEHVAARDFVERTDHVPAGAGERGDVDASGAAGGSHTEDGAPGVTIPRLRRRCGGRTSTFPPHPARQDGAEGSL